MLALGASQVAYNKLEKSMVHFGTQHSDRLEKNINQQVACNINSLQVCVCVRLKLHHITYT